MADQDPAAAPSPRVFETAVRARSYELDGFRHVNHAVFLNWLELARFDALREGGFSMESMEARGWAVVVVRVEVDFRDEVLLDDELLVRTTVEDTRQTSMTLAQRIVRTGRPGGGDDETLVAEARVVAVWLEDGRPVRIPAGVREALGAA